MSILSDKQIRARSMAPTHKSLDAFGSSRYYAKVGNTFYGLATGELIKGDANDYWRTQMRELTPSEIEGYCTMFPRMITPYEPELVRTKKVKRFQAADYYDEHKVISYGTSSYGYDVRCADEFKIFTNINSTVIDPKNFDEKSFVDFKGDVCIIPPNSFALARTIERFDIPRDMLTVCLGKSTYARCGIIVNVTPFEPEWEGYVTLEFSNTTPLPAKIYANEGVAQVLFFKADDVCETSYSDRGGKYQGQDATPVCPKV